MPLYVSLPKLVEAEFHDTGLDMLGGPQGVGRPGYEILVDGPRNTYQRKDRFDAEHIPVPDGVSPEQYLATILKFIGLA